MGRTDYDDLGERRSWGGDQPEPLRRDPEQLAADAQQAAEDDAAAKAERLAEQYGDGHPEGCSW